MVMTPIHRHFHVERRANVVCVRLRSHHIPELEIHEICDDLVDLAQEQGCRGVALSLGPKSPECLYSVFLAKLYWVQRVLGEQGRGLVLCEVEPDVRTVFEAARLDDRFRFAADFDAAVVELAA
jgi:hypothetical protein